MARLRQLPLEAGGACVICGEAADRRHTCKSGEIRFRYRPRKAGSCPAMELRQRGAPSNQ